MSHTTARPDRVVASRRPAVIVTAAVATVAVVAGCQAGATRGSPPRSPGVTAMPRSLTDARDAAARAALDTYRAMWQAYAAASRGPDTDTPALTRYASGDALRVLRDGLRWARDRTLPGSGTFSMAPAVSEASPTMAPTTVKIRDCVDVGDLPIVGGADGDPPGGLRLVLATVTRRGDGGWAVTDLDVGAVGTCVG